MEHLPDPPDWRALLRRQHGAVSRAQLFARGLNKAGIAAHLKAGRWQRPLAGVYVTFSGPLPLLTKYWVALLHAGPGAVLSHSTAGSLWQLIPSAAGPVHVTVPAGRAPRSKPGLVVHRAAVAPVPVGSPPRTNATDTVLALCGEARRPSEVAALLGRVAQQHPRVLAEVTALAAQRRNLRWRRELLAVAQDVAGGVHSELERRHLVDVERAHGLPTGRRQRAAGKTRQDAYYDEFATVVELDGRVVHVLSDASWRDMVRDNATAERGETTLRYGWQDVRHRPCEVAAQMASVLRANGWTGHARPCRPGCPVAEIP